MAILVVYGCASLLLFILFQVVSPPLTGFTADFRWAPFPLNFILAVEFTLAAYEVGILAITVATVAFIHTLWILTGAWYLSKAVRKTWKEAGDSEVFEDGSQTSTRPHPPSLEQGASSTTWTQGDAGILIDVDDGPDLYSGLDSDRGEIRLLKPIIDGINDGDPHFELICEPLNSMSRQDYVALSYCWGSDPPHEKIFIRRPGSPFRQVTVRPNLYKALSRLIAEKGPIFVWVDALCINQDDLVERSMQVVRMRNIFQSAETVIPWIPDTGPQPRNRTINGNGPVTSVDHGQYPSSPTEGVFDFVLSSLYWSRLWIIQEFALARNIEVLTERRNIRGHELVDLLQQASAGGKSYTLERAKNVMEVRIGCRKDKEPGFLDLLLRTSLSFSDKRHDRVFGILSMARDGRKFLTEPSYGIARNELSLRMTRSYLENSGDSHLDIIILGAHFFRKNGGLPSWCPDYFGFDDLPADLRPFEYVRDVFGRGEPLLEEDCRPLYKASLGSTCKVTFNPDNVLCCKAFLLGTIGSLGWIVSDQNKEVFPFPKESTTASDARGPYIAAKLWNLFRTLSPGDFGDTTTQSEALSTAQDGTGNDYKTCAYPYIYFMLLVFGGSRYIQEADIPDGSYARWLLANQHFCFNGQTLRDYAKHMKPVLGYRDFWRWAQSLKGSMLASTDHRELREWKRLHRPLKKLAKQNMRLMVLTADEEGIVGLAHAAARKGDEVFLLSGCSVPVILRKVHGQDQYSMIGDAIVPGAMFGEKWSGSDREVKIK